MKLFFRKLDVPGKGIPRNAATAKKGFARLWEIFTVEYKSLCILSLVFSLFCIPVVTIPAAMAAMARISVYMVDDEPRFLWHDFLKAFKENFWKATLFGWGMFLAMAIMALSMIVYREGFAQNIYLTIPACILLIVEILFNQMLFYAYPMLVRTDLNLRAIFKNSFLLLFLKGNGIKNFAMLVFEAAVFILSIFYAPFTPAILPLYGFGLLSLCATFISWPSIKQYVIK